VHDRGIIHFDVKPHNILLDRSGSVKLCDLGISRLAPTSRHGGTASAAAGDAAQEPALMKASVQAGTPSYMAPELIRGDGALVGPAVDVFAFGIVLWQLYHLQPPHPKVRGRQGMLGAD
jgi:serine/threonine protein kinase